MPIFNHPLPYLLSLMGDHPVAAIQALGVLATFLAVAVALFNPRVILSIQREDAKHREQRLANSTAIALFADLSRMEAEFSALHEGIEEYRNGNVNVDDRVLWIFHFDPESLVDRPELWVDLMPTHVTEKLVIFRLVASHYVRMIDRYSRISPSKLDNEQIYTDLSDFSRNAVKTCREALQALRQAFPHLAD